MTQHALNRPIPANNYKQINISIYKCLDRGVNLVFVRYFPAGCAWDLGKRVPYCILAFAYASAEGIKNQADGGCSRTQSIHS